MKRSALSLADHGASFHPGVLMPDDVASLRDLCDQLISRKAGTRIFASARLVDLLIRTGRIGQLVQTLFASQDMPTLSAKPVRAVMFDKSAGTNWALGWHQDRTIAVRQRIDTAGFGPWTIKSGSVHVEPPFDVTRRMITLRLHLDDVDEQNAPLLIVPGSHAQGRIPASRIAGTVAALGSVSCLAETGDIWAYATSILHASDKAAEPRRRRVLQVDFSADELPGGLEWLGIDGLDVA